MELQEIIDLFKENLKQAGYKITHLYLESINSDDNKTLDIRINYKDN